MSRLINKQPNYERKRNTRCVWRQNHCGLSLRGLCFYFMFTMGHSQCGNGPSVLGSMGHLKSQGANPASRRPRNIPQKISQERCLTKFHQLGKILEITSKTVFLTGFQPARINININTENGPLDRWSKYTGLNPSQPVCIDRR